jgi:adenosylmethionine-8-amino-7-oxononanoate aminotransferase
VWFAAEHWGLRPDIITAGKGASSGYWPMGLCIASGEVHDAVEHAGGFAHGFTWSHHPIGAAVGTAVIDLMERDGLVEAAATLGVFGLDRLRTRLADHPYAGDVRGTGLLMAVEFVADRETKSPFDRHDRVAERVIAAAFANGLTVYPCTSAVDGAVGDAVLLGPPLCVTESELAEMIDRLVSAIADVFDGGV